MSKRIVLCAAFVAALLPFTIGHASAMLGSLTVVNPTDKFVRVTVYTSNPSATWSISTTACVKPKAQWKYELQERHNNEVKLQAEVKTGDCYSGNISDTNDVRKDVGAYPKLFGDIYFYQGRYYVAFR